MEGSGLSKLELDLKLMTILKEDDSKNTSKGKTTFT